MGGLGKSLGHVHRGSGVVFCLKLDCFSDCKGHCMTRKKGRKKLFRQLWSLNERPLSQLQSANVTERLCQSSPWHLSKVGHTPRWERHNYAWSVSNALCCKLLAANDNPVSGTFTTLFHQEGFLPLSMTAGERGTIYVYQFGGDIVEMKG